MRRCGCWRRMGRRVTRRGTLGVAASLRVPSGGQGERRRCAEFRGVGVDAAGVQARGGGGDFPAGGAGRCRIPKLNHRVPRESLRALKAIARQYAGAVGRGLSAVRRTEAEAGGVAHAVRAEVLFQRVAWSRARVVRRVAELEKIFAVEGVTDFPHGGGLPPFTRGMEMARLQIARAVERVARAGGAESAGARARVADRTGGAARCGLEVCQACRRRFGKTVRTRPRGW